VRNNEILNGEHGQNLDNVSKTYQISHMILPQPKNTPNRLLDTQYTHKSVQNMQNARGGGGSCRQRAQSVPPRLYEISAYASTVHSKGSKLPAQIPEDHMVSNILLLRIPNVFATQQA